MAFSALATGVSGLQAFSQGIGTIADNITNVNTIGYKESRARFSTLVTETAAFASFSPGGVQAQARSIISTQGLLQPTGSASDLSIDGSGFFIVRDAPQATDASGEILYTRAGNFTPDADGFYRNTAGFTLLGWPIDAQGNLPPNLNDPGVLEPINISDLNGLGDDTNSVSLRVNLDATTSVTPIAMPMAVPPVPGYTAGDIAAGNMVPDFETNIQIFDSLGRDTTLLLSALKTGVNEWSYELRFDEPAQLDPTEHTDGVIGTGTFKFNTDGTIDLGNSTLTASDNTPVNLNTGEGLTFHYAVGGPDGVEVDPGNIVFDFGDDGRSNGFTQFDNRSTLISSSVDGARFDNVNGISIDQEGIVTAVFNNGLTLDIFQLPIVTFPNPDGLSLRQGNSYSISNNSGDPAFQIAGTGGAGSIAPGTLELSTVDLSEEFSELIKVQRAFSASARIITTSDEILTELTQLV